MKLLQGKKIKICSVGGKEYIGNVIGANDDLVRILVDGEEDELVIYIKNIYSYQIIGEGTSGGYSGLNVWACKNDSIGCKGKTLLSCKTCDISDMNCPIQEKKTVVGKGFNCDFGNLGPMEVIPSKAQKILFEGLMKENKGKKK